MSEKFGDLLRQHRKAAHLTQKHLGGKIQRDIAIISRLETGAILPNSELLQSLIVALSGHLTQEDIALLRKSAGLDSEQTLGSSEAESVLEPIRLAFDMLKDSRDKELLKEDLLKTLKIDQEYFDARKRKIIKNWGDAAKQLKDLRSELDRRIQNWNMRIDQELGDCLYSNISFSSALSSYYSALMSAIQLNDIQKQGEIRIKIGNIYRRRGGAKNFETARTYYEKAETCFGEDKKMRAECKRKIAGALLFEGKPDQAEKFCDESLILSKEANDTQSIYKALQHAGWLNSMFGKWDKAVDQCRQALDMTNENEWDRIKALRYLGDACRIARRAKEAEKHYEDALKLVEKKTIGPSRTKGLIYLGLAKLFLKQPERILEAQTYLEKGIDIYGDFGEDARAIDFYAEQGRVLMKLGRFHEARAKLELAKHKYEGEENSFQIARTVASICELIYIERGKDSLGEIKEISESVKNKFDPKLINYHLAQIDLTLGSALADNGQSTEAADTWHVAAERALQFNVLSFVELSNKIIQKLGRVGKANNVELTKRLCENYKAMLGNQRWLIDEQKAIQASLNDLERLQKDIEKMRHNAA